MARKADLTTSKGDVSIKIGSTGTVGVLMSRELNSTIKSLTPDKTTSLSSTDQRKIQATPISVPCCSMVMLNRKMQRSKTMPIKEKSSVVTLEQCSQVPILHSNEIITERSTRMREKSKKKVRHCNLVQLVDLTCGGNPMSSRLRKLGFSKLSKSFS